jgi:hypothetical protein
MSLVDLEQRWLHQNEGQTITERARNIFDHWIGYFFLRDDGGTVFSPPSMDDNVAMNSSITSCPCKEEIQIHGEVPFDTFEDRRAMCDR